MPTPMPTPIHPELIATAMDMFAAQTEPLPTSAWSIKLTEAMRRYATRSGIPESDLMPLTDNPNGNYYEVPGRWIPRIAKAIGAESTGLHRYRGRRVERHWAMPTVTEQWEAARDAEAALRANVAERVQVRRASSSDYSRRTIRVIADDRLIAEFTIEETTGWEDGEPVFTERLGEELANELAEHAAKKVRTQIVQRERD